MVLLVNQRAAGNRQARRSGTRVTAVLARDHRDAQIKLVRDRLSAD